MGTPDVRLPFYRLMTIGWANPLLRQTLQLFSQEVPREFVIDLSEVEFLDSFGITYFAACLHSCGARRGIGRVLINPPKRRNVNSYLQDVGLYESFGLDQYF